MILKQMAEQKEFGQKGLRNPLWLGTSFHQPRPCASVSLVGLHRALPRLPQVNRRAQRAEPATAGLNTSPYQSVMAGDRPRNKSAGERTRTDHPTVEHLRGARR